MIEKQQNTSRTSFELGDQVAAMPAACTWPTIFRNSSAKQLTLLHCVNLSAGPSGNINTSRADVLVEKDHFHKAIRRSTLKIVAPFFSNLQSSLPRHHHRLQRWYIYCSIHLLKVDLSLNNIDRAYFMPIGIMHC